MPHMRNVILACSNKFKVNIKVKLVLSSLISYFCNKLHITLQN